jgi:hypothetical protein
LQLEDWLSGFDSEHTSRGRFAPRLGRPGDYDVARIRVAKHVFKSRKPGEVAHCIINRPAFCEALFDDSF